MDKDLLHRIKSIRQTVQISGAQKLIAASQIGKARRLLNESKPYHDRVTRAIADMLDQSPETASKYIGFLPANALRRGLIVLSASRGLTGGFNSNIIHMTEGYLKENNVSYIIALGNACRGHLINENYPVDREYIMPLDPPTMFTAREIAEKITEMLDRSQIQAFDIIYTKFRSAVRMEPVCEKLFPLEPKHFSNYADKQYFFDFEPSASHVLDSMMLKYIKGFIYGCLVHTHLCELTSRLTAMDSAIRNGNEILDALSLQYNRERQAAITQEITEIVASASALN